MSASVVRYRPARAALLWRVRAAVLAPTAAVRCSALASRPSSPASASARSARAGSRHRWRRPVRAGTRTRATVEAPELSRSERRASSEANGLAREIAGCLHDFALCRQPTASVLQGEGGGASALAIIAAPDLIATEHAWLAPLAPEGASTILYGNDERSSDSPTHPRDRPTPGWSCARHRA